MTDNYVGNFVPIRQLSNFGLQLNYSRHLMLSFQKKKWGYIYNRDKGMFPTNILEIVFLLDI